jgi:thymidylate synthase (FAD)
MTNENIPDTYKRIHNLGFVGLLDHMGDDAAIVQAARTSYSKATTVTRNDVGLINYLMRNEHTSPFEMAEVKLHIRAPIFVMRQLVRHRTANLNEESGRYSVMEEEYYIPAHDEVTGQSTTNKQMAGGGIEVSAKISTPNIVLSQSQAAFETYHYLLSIGVAREMARIVLPLNTYSTVVWKCDLHNLLRMLRLRLDEHAQQQIQDYAQAIYEFVQPLFPATFAAWDNYVRNAVKFSVSEQKMLRVILKTLTAQELRMMTLNNILGPQEMSTREYEEFYNKLIEIKGNS